MIHFLSVRNISLRMKILSLIGALFLVMLAVGAGFLWRDSRMEKSSAGAIRKSEFAKTVISKSSDHIQWLNDLYNSILAGTPFSGALDGRECSFGVWYHSLKTEDLDPELAREIRSVSRALEESHELLHRLARTLLDASRAGNKEEAFLILNTKIPAAVVEFTGYLDHLIGAAEEESRRGIETYQKQMAGMKRMLILFVLIAFTGVIALAVIISENTVRRINGVVMDLASGSSQITSASSQLSKASLSIASGAGEQAASVEQTSAGLEEISSIAAQNTKNAREAVRFVENTKILVDNASANMMNMSSAIKDIVQSSQQIGKIIKTIDDIAFQTNLLALNAAVEAARAGESGAGFAVVADEVRNLALRSAASAKSTQDMIGEVIRKIRSGEELVEGTRSAFLQVVEATQRIVESVAGITAASEQQNSGIRDIQKAIGELNNVIQQNAGASEETSSASEELNAQAEGLLHIVKDLNRVVLGGASAVLRLNAGKALRGPEKPGKKAALPTPVF